VGATVEVAVQVPVSVSVVMLANLPLSNLLVATAPRHLSAYQHRHAHT